MKNRREKQNRLIPKLNLNYATVQKHAEMQTGKSQLFDYVATHSIVTCNHLAS